MGRFSIINFLKVSSIIFLINDICSNYYRFTFNNFDIASGYAKDRFLKVAETFRNNFASGFEREGAALAIYHKGELVVNIWGGYADRVKGRKWTSNTVTPIFSGTKAFASLVIAVLVDRGLLKYDDKVVKYWPEYGANGKENTTIEDVLTHKAGIPYLEEPISIDDVLSGKIMQNIANATPIWEPGTESGYHGFTFGPILDGIVMNVDPKRRNVAQYFNEEIASAYGLDAHIGYKDDFEDRLAKVTSAPFLEYIRDSIHSPRILIMLGLMQIRGSIINKMISNTPWVQIDCELVSLNDPSILSLPLSALSGIASASDFARAFSLILSSQIISKETLLQLREPTLNSWHIEKVMTWPFMKGHGFHYESHPFIQGAYIFGHPGWGGQFVHVDPWTETIIVYVTNGLKTGTGIFCAPYMAIFNEFYYILSSSTK